MGKVLTLSFVQRQLLQHLRLVHSLKTALAVGVGYWVGILFHIPALQWILITIIVVMGAQTTLGSFVKKSYARTLGTILGAILGIAILALWPGNTVIIGIMLMICTIPFIYLAFRKDDLSYAGVLGIITVIMIVMAQPPILIAGLERMMDVAIGIVLSALMTFLVFPTYARCLFLKNLASIAQDFLNLFTDSMLEGKTRKTHTHLQKLDEKIEAGLVEQRKLLGDCKAEWPRKKGLLSLYKEILLTCSRIHRYLNFMEYYFYADQQIQDILKREPIFTQYCHQVQEMLRFLVKQLGFETKSPDFPYSLPDVKALEVILNLPSPSHSDEKISLIHAFLLATQRLNVYFEALLKLINR